MLIRFLHGSPIGMSRAVETFQEMWHSDETRGKVSKRQLTKLISTLVKKCMRPGNIMKVFVISSSLLIHSTFTLSLY